MSLSCGRPSQHPTNDHSCNDSTQTRAVNAANSTAFTRATVNTANAAPATVQVAVKLGEAIADGASRIGIRLHPAELGRVDVSLDIRADGRVHAVILADRADTLDTLRNDARLLERALADAGLDTTSGGLEFGLREQQPRFEQEGGHGHAHAEPDDAELVTEPPAWVTDDANWRNGALDIRV